MDPDNQNSKVSENLLYLGVDVQIRRPCTYYVLDQNLDHVTSGHLGGGDIPETSENMQALAVSLGDQHSEGLAVGIDAPRRGLTSPRPWYWRNGGWRLRSKRDRGFGRHCEVVIKALGLGNPQWTRLAGNSPPWMALGYRLFETLSGLTEVFEVFPSASYYMLRDVVHPTISLCLNGFASQPKDMLDACVAAYTVWAFFNGRGTEVGGGDGLGTIVLPEKLVDSDSNPVLSWPDDQACSE